MASSESLNHLQLSFLAHPPCRTHTITILDLNSRTVCQKSVMAESRLPPTDKEKLKKAFDFSHFDINAILRGIQLTLVGGKKASGALTRHTSMFPFFFFLAARVYV
jgi:hypothetical protein